jgi:hypothetical protein
MPGRDRASERRVKERRGDGAPRPGDGAVDTRAGDRRGGPGAGRGKTGDRAGSKRDGADAGAFLPAASALALAIGFYVWVIGGPVPIEAAAAKGSEQPDPLAGLPLALVIGVVAGVVIAALGTSLSAARPWLGRIVLASGALYLGASCAALGGGGLVLAGAAAAAALAAFAVRREEIEVDGVVLALHAGMFGAALCLFHEWPRFAAGWEPFRQNLAALGALWL